MKTKLIHIISSIKTYIKNMYTIGTKSEPKQIEKKEITSRLKRDKILDSVLQLHSMQLLIKIKEDLEKNLDKVREQEKLMKDIHSEKHTSKYYELVQRLNDLTENLSKINKEMVILRNNLDNTVEDIKKDLQLITIKK